MRFYNYLIGQCMENVTHSVWYIVCTKSNDHSLSYKKDVIPSVTPEATTVRPLTKLPILKNWKWIISEMNMGNTWIIGPEGTNLSLQNFSGDLSYSMRCVPLA